MRRFWRSSIGVVAVIAAVFAITTMAVGLAAYHVMHEALEVQLDHRVAGETSALIDEGADSPIGVAGAIRRRDAARSTASLDYLLIDADGGRLAGLIVTSTPMRLGYRELLQYRVGATHHIGQSLTTELPGGAMLVVAADRTVINEMDATLFKLFAAAFGTMLLLGVGAAWAVAAITRGRLSRIDRTALAIIEGDLARRVPIGGSGDEFDRVAGTLNRMLDRIAGLMDSLRQVSSDVAHDLRTPLTRLHNRLEDALSSSDAADRQQAITAATEQSRELLDIFASLLRIAEVEALGARGQFQQIALDRLVEELVETYRPDFEAGGHRLRFDGGETIMISGDRRLLQQLVSNLLENILRHTPEGTTARVSLSHAEATARLVVTDDGPGVAKADAQRLFQRFARAERSRSTDGHGLGLALVAAIAGAHKGAAQLTGGPGFSVIVDLPRDG